MKLPPEIVLVHAPPYIESGCPHTYGDKETETAFIVFPCSVVDLKVMIHECIHVHQKFVGHTEKLYLNNDRVIQLQHSITTHRLNPDANPIEYANDTTTNMLEIKGNERDVLLEERAYLISQWLDAIAITNLRL